MFLTDKQKYDLNNMNVAAQRAQLGNMLGEFSGSITSLSTTTSEISGSFSSLEDMAYQSASAIDITGGYINGVKYGSETDYSEFEGDGTLVFSGSATVWNDIFFPLVTAKQGQTDQPLFSTTEVAYLFPQNDTSHLMYIVAQFPHDMKVGSDISPHVHWKQTQSGSVVFKMDYKWFPVGGSVPATFETHEMGRHVVPYTSGSIHQINAGETRISGSIIDTSGYGVSSLMLIKLYRDDNTYTANAVTYQFDIHFEKDTFGSRTEFDK